MAARGQVDDARRRAGEQRRHQQAREQEVADVVGAELHLEAVGRVLERRVHHAGVVDRADASSSCRSRNHDANARTLASDVRSSIPTSRSASGTLRADRRGGGFGLLRVPRREHDVRTRGGERPRRLQPDAGRRAGDDRDLPAQVDAVEHLVGRALEAEGHAVLPFSCVAAVTRSSRGTSCCCEVRARSSVRCRQRVSPKSARRYS